MKRTIVTIYRKKVCFLIIQFTAESLEALVEKKGNRCDKEKRFKKPVEIHQLKTKEVFFLNDFSVISFIGSFPSWDKLLTVALNLADEFCVIFPNGAYNPENPLVNGKPEFTSLANLKVGRWPNMKDSSAYFGSMDDSIRKLFLEFNDQASDNDKDYLWHYSLYRDGIELLNVQDSTVCYIDLDTELTALLLQLKIDWRDD